MQRRATKSTAPKPRKPKTAPAELTADTPETAAPKAKTRGVMSDDTIRAILDGQITTSLNYLTDKYTRWRILAERRYEGRSDIIPSEKGRSKAISHDVSDNIDAQMANLIPIFAGSDTVCRFDSRLPEYMDEAKQATEAVNWVYNVQNDGFLITHQWAKAGLQFRIGIAKSWWEKRESVKEETYEGLNDAEYAQLISDDEITVLEETVYPDPNIRQALENRIKAAITNAIINNQPPPQIPPITDDQLPKLRDVTVKRVTERGQVKVDVVPSEHLIFNTYKVHQEDRMFIAERRRLSRSELKELGYDDKLIEQVAFSPLDYTTQQEEFERFEKETKSPFNDGTPGDESSDMTYVTECYIYIDIDRDGVAEYRKITVAGENSLIILDNEIVDDHPFAIWSPIPMPFKMVGLSMTDQLEDVQDIRSVVTRHMLDNFYQGTHNRLAIGKNVNYNDVVNPRPNSPIRVNGIPGNEIMPITHENIAAEALGVMEHFKDVGERRTGISMMSQGLDADQLDSQSAYFARAMMAAGAKRMELIARVFGEVGFKRLFRRILDLLKKHQRTPLIAKINGQFVAWKPTNWTCEYDVVCEVGLGSNNKDQQLGHIMSMLPVMQSLIPYQKEAGIEIVSPVNIFSMVREAWKAAGFKNPEMFVTDPTQQIQAKAQQPQQPPPPTSDMMKAMLGKAQLDEKKREFDAKHQFNMSKLKGDLSLKVQELVNDYAYKLKDLNLEALKIHHGDQDAAAQRDVDTYGIQANATVARADRAAKVAMHISDHAADRAKLHADNYHKMADRSHARQQSESDRFGDFLKAHTASKQRKQTDE